MIGDPQSIIVAKVSYAKLTAWAITVILVIVCDVFLPRIFFGSYASFLIGSRWGLAWLVGSFTVPPFSCLLVAALIVNVLRSRGAALYLVGHEIRFVGPVTFKTDLDELLGVSISPGRRSIVTLTTTSRPRGKDIGVLLLKESPSEIADRLSELIRPKR
jgi:hypothetical protein